jgi:hypothetical protein
MTILVQEKNATAVRLDDGDIHCPLLVALFITQIERKQNRELS